MGGTRHGLVIGKFYPPHAGHHLLISTAAACSGRVTVLVLSHEVESIPHAALAPIDQLLADGWDLAAPRLPRRAS